jgi:DNA repair protein SbcC/Rad50
MDGPRLHAILIENFRSINRKIEVRLDAPVVIIHGPNGVGKTSFLSAIELALTGAIPSLARADPSYKAQLLYHGADEGRVVLNVRDVENAPDPISVTLRSRGLTASDKLNDAYARFFSERCNLAQSLLTQLLTIYQESDARVDSLLSRFVHELLGLDRLDALELGLEPGRDLRNARKIAPTYDDVERELDKITREINEARALLAQTDAAFKQSQTALQSALAVLEIQIPATTVEEAALERVLRSTDEERALIDLADKNRQLIALRRELGRQTQNQLSIERSSLEAAHARSQSELALWREVYSGQIDTALGDVRQLFPNAETPVDSNPGQAVADAMVLVSTDLERLEAVAEREQADAERRVQLEDAIVQARSRIAALGQEIASVAIDAGALSVALSQLIPHIHSDHCPVCDRDYSEVSEDPLSARVADRVAELTDQAERLRVLTAERTALERQLATLDRESEALKARALSSQASLDLQDRLTKLRKAVDSLRPLKDAAATGSNLIVAELNVRRRLVSMQTASGEQNALRLSIVEQAASLGLPEPDQVESLSVMLDRLDQHVRERELRLRARLEASNAARQHFEAARTHRKRILELGEVIARNEDARKRVTTAFAAAERIRADVRRILTVASTTRAAIIGRVFNDRLNSLWRDLFVRLAPGEAFVPAFRVPTHPQRRLVPALETRHRSGGTGGTPGAMLSTGNLNTAALTLFLALHLSVKPQLPWLILDDPVQSMDEVHITQFAALLRTLAKEHHRQVIITVHDRPLYDYLCLELSPAFSGDELITIELEMSAAGQTRVATRRRGYEPDTALKPVAA